MFIVSSQVALSVIRFPDSLYLFRIAHNILVDHYRRVGRLPDLTSTEHLELPDPGAGPEREFTQFEIRAAISGALADLPAAQRETFLPHEEAGLTLEQIATIVGTARETIKSRLRYALNRLRRDLREREAVEVRQA